MFKKLKEKFSSWIKKSSEEEKIEEPKPAVAKKEIPEKEKISSEKALKKKADKIEKETPKKFNVGTQSYVPDTEQIKEEINETLPPPKEKTSFFTKLKAKLSTSTLTQEQFDEIFQDLEITLLENNVALQAVDKIKEELSKDLVGIEIKKSEIEKTIITSLKDAILSILKEPPNLLEQINKSLDTFTILFVGINGSGKTTNLAKLAHYLKQNKISCVLAAADTFRAASIEQLQLHAKKLNIPIISHQYGSDPAAVAFDAKKYAKAHKIKVVLIDTAGRMYTKTNLIKEMEKIVRVSKPNLKIFVGESITGNDATEQAKTFNEAIDIDGIILSKADIDEKAGTILSVSHITNKPIYFLGTGQSLDSLKEFKKKNIIKSLGF